MIMKQIKSTQMSEGYRKKSLNDILNDFSETKSYFIMLLVFCPLSLLLIWRLTTPAALKPQQALFILKKANSGVQFDFVGNANYCVVQSCYLHSPADC